MSAHRPVFGQMLLAEIALRASPIRPFSMLAGYATQEGDEEIRGRGL
ncbi:MAG: hypothetical protein NXY59_08475 [Aigarchaeota archaeon]|nr:hypothetical protein [Candidatus Pelearchaeum maunauluense]